MTVTDSKGCKTTIDVTISEPENALSATASNQVNVSCKGGNDGSVVITPAGGTAGYTITPAQTGLTAGVHTFTVTDAKGCSTTIDVTISEPENALALATSSKTDASCNGSSTGSVTAGTVTNAVGTVTYSWKNAANTEVGTTATVNNLPAGTYTLTVTDNCSSQSNSVTIGQPANPLDLAASSKTDATCYGDSSGSVTAGAVTNAVGTVTYSWKNASNSVVGTTATVNNLPAGTYTLTVTDNCSSQSNSVTIGQPAAIEPINIEAVCNTDRTEIINLNGYLPSGTPLNGTWIDDNTNTLNNNEFKPFNVPTGSYTFEYQVTVGECPLSYFVTIPVTDLDCGLVLGCGTILVHNAFTPNGDGTNEVFKIDNLEDTICYPENTVEIYNRWGVLVYETKGYNNSDKSFKGFSEGRVTIDKSAGLPTGTYFYILNYTSVGLQGELIPNKQQGYLYLTR